MNLKHLQTLSVIADCGSFNGAAERLGITQSAISMQMKALEEDLQAEVFDRSLRPPRINAAGRALVEGARDILQRVETLKAEASSARGLSGTLRLGVVPSASVGLLPAALGNLANLHPNLRIRIVSGLSAGLIEQVQRGRLDGAVVTTRPGESHDGLTLEPIFTESLMVVAHNRLPETPAEQLLQDHPFIRFNSRTGVGQIIDQALRRMGLEVSEVMELDSLEAILHMVRNRLGVSIVPERSITPEFAASLRRLPFGDPPLTRDVSLVVRQSAEAAPLMAPLLAELKRTADQR